jgi:hypothetical protein
VADRLRSRGSSRIEVWERLAGADDDTAETLSAFRAALADARDGRRARSI